MQRELGYRVYLVGIGKGMRVRGLLKKERKRDGTEKERKEERGRERQRLPFQKDRERKDRDGWSDRDIGED